MPCCHNLANESRGPEIRRFRSPKRLTALPVSRTVASVKKNSRTIEIDGIRGWAAFSVLAFHILWEMLGALIPSLRSRYLSPLINGDLDVCIFFVLSGDALSSPFFHGSMDDIDRLLVNRYLRLTIPIAMSCALVFALMTLGLDYHVHAAAIVHVQSWLGVFLNFPPSLYGLVNYSLIGVYADHHPETAYNPMLWTMAIEMVGSMATFLTCYVWSRLRNPIAVVAAVGLFLLVTNSMYCLFFAGVLLGYARREGWLDQLRANLPWQVVSVLLPAAVYVVLVPFKGSPVAYFDLIAAIVLVVCFYTNRGFLAFFRARVSRILGDVSFPVYLVQFPIIISLMSWMLLQGDLTRVRLCIIAVAAMAATLVVAQAFRWIEKPLLRYAGKKTRELLGSRVHDIAAYLPRHAGKTR